MYRNQLINKNFKSLSDYIEFSSNNKNLKEAGLNYNHNNGEVNATMIDMSKC